MCIQPENPQQNTHAERYNRAVTTQWFGRCHFDTIEEALDSGTGLLWTYNNERTNMVIGGVTQKQ